MSVRVDVVLMRGVPTAAASSRRVAACSSGTGQYPQASAPLSRRRARGHRPSWPRSIGPAWDANHVRLILNFVVLWTSFPEAYASITLTLFVPLMIAALGIVHSRRDHLGEERLPAARRGSGGQPEQPDPPSSVAS